ncbi:glucose-6-phosphate 1-dehydrogenase [Nitzschia inconspicua]|uniref:Glucose-6-phosphate 1-dehydrogenase n=1 Tax=Nitzschia inconspicua TaxID=303405 RepID=A0A9K3KY93_9STRA|nr:glucose-6-phosphate 1-dehydrogenase [Nitzschia inconspicua]
MTTVNGGSYMHVTSRLSSQFSSNEDDVLDVSSATNSIHEAISQESWYQQTLSVVVVGASGDLAKKKTYPSLLKLFEENLLPADGIIYGYARSRKSHEEFRRHLLPHLKKTGTNEIIVKDFLSKCYYHSGKTYGDKSAYADMIGDGLVPFEESTKNTVSNRLFYLAVPPDVFGESGVVIKTHGMSTTGWTRVVIEKPFGQDLESCDALLQTLSENFEEHHLYRIDHYLGKEIVQNMLMFRFSNSFWEPIWNSDTIESVVITFKEPFGTDGRGGYFDKYGIIRDILQNHLLQVATLFAMEPPKNEDADAIRDAKVEVLKSMEILSLQDCLLGQYDGYSDDPTITNKDTNCPTYAAIRCKINNPRWKGVPFILQAGKAMDEKVCDIQVRFKPAKSFPSMRRSSKNFLENAPAEMVMRLQPDPCISLNLNIKSPGFSTMPTRGNMVMRYEDMPNLSNPDAYTRLLLDVIRGKQGSFVRDDELRFSWQIFTPLLHAIDDTKVRPLPYRFGSSGPANREAWMAETTKSVLPLQASL